MSSKIYTLGYTGPEVDEAINKIQNLDITSLSGGIIELESTQSTPYNLNFLRVVGLYRAAFVYDLTAPSGASSISPVYIYVSKADDGSENGKLIQSINAGGVTYTRTSFDGGMTWNVWELGDGQHTVSEITAEEVDQIFANVFGENIDSAAVANVLAASNRLASSAPITKTSSSIVSRNIAF